MAITKLQDVSAGANGNPAVVLASVTADSFLVACITVKSTSSGVNSVTDTRGNRWRKALDGYSNNNEQASIWYAQNPNAGACTVTATMAIVRDTVMNVSEWSGMTGAYPRVNKENKNASGTAHLSGTVTPPGDAEDLIIALLSIGSAELPVTHDAGPAFTALTDFTLTTSVLRADYKVVTTSRANEQMSWTAGVAGTSIGIAQIFGIGSGDLIPDFKKHPRMNMRH